MPAFRDIFLTKRKNEAINNIKPKKIDNKSVTTKNDIQIKYIRTNNNNIKYQKEVAHPWLWSTFRISAVRFSSVGSTVSTVCRRCVDRALRRLHLRYGEDSALVTSTTTKGTPMDASTLPPGKMVELFQLQLQWCFKGGIMV